MHYYIIYALSHHPCPPFPDDHRLQTLVCSRYCVERRARQRNESNFFPILLRRRVWFIPRPYPLVFTSAAGTPLYTTRKVYYYYYYYFPTSNPPVFPSHLDVLDRIFYLRRSAHCDNLLFLHPLTRIYDAHPTYIIYIYIYT